MEGLVGTIYGSDNQFEVISYIAGSRKVKSKYKVVCHTCAKDTELFGEGSFLMVSDQIKRGVSRCGCSHKYIWSEEQNRVRVGRKCIEKGITFKGWHGKYDGDMTYLSLSCVNSHCYTSTTINKLFSGRGCRICRDNNLRNLYTPPEEYTIDHFMSLGRFKTGTIFCKEGNMWTYKCPVCSYDSLAMSGLCSGVFVGNQGKMKIGQMSCRCSPNWSGWNQNRRSFQINGILNKSHISLVGWEDDGYGQHSRITINCSEHGNHTLTLGSFLYNGTRCPRCSKYGFQRDKTAIFYVLKFSNEINCFTGYGISGRIDSRLKQHFVTLSRAGYTIQESKLFKGSGGDVLNLETVVKTIFPRAGCTAKGFIKESTYGINYKNLVNFVTNYLVKEK